MDEQKQVAFTIPASEYEVLKKKAEATERSVAAYTRWQMRRLGLFGNKEEASHD